MAKTKAGVPAKAKSNLPATGGMNFRRDQTGGKSNMDVDSLATPFLKVLQKGSPQVDESSGVTLKGAKEGMFYETTSQRLHDGKKGIIIVPCGFRRIFVHWGPKFGQFKGTFTPEQVAGMRADETLMTEGNRLFFPINGKIDVKKCDRVVDTREHYLLLLEKDRVQRILFPLASTQIKKSRHLNSALDDFRIEDDEGSFSPPTYAHRIRATTAAESNDEGSWAGVNFAFDRLLNENDAAEVEVYKIAKAFSESIEAGRVAGDYSKLDEGPVGDDDTRETPERRRGF